MTVQSVRDVNGNGDTAGDRAIFNKSGVPGTGTDVTALTNSAGAVVAYVANNPTAQYIRAGQYALANVGRNTLPSRPIDDVDITVLKRISVTERLRVEFSAQAFNVLNHPQFVPGYLNDVKSIGFTSDRTFLNPGAANFNQVEGIFPSNARTLQLGLKVIF
jgi:hypothetical protein